MIEGKMTKGNITEDDDIISKLEDLHYQARTERSHYYAAKVIKEAMSEIESLREKLRNTPVKKTVNRSEIYTIGTLDGLRRSGNTSVLIGVLLSNPEAKMVVHSYDMLKELSGKYGLPRERFITVDNLENGLCSFGGPVVFDIPAISKMISNSVNDHKEHTPKIVCLCGSTKFKDDFLRIQAELTLEGYIVVGPELFGHAGDDLQGKKEQLDELHLRKIDLADKVIVVCPGGYIGESTSREIQYAEKIGKPIEYDGFFDARRASWSSSIRPISKTDDDRVYEEWKKDFVKKMDNHIAQLSSNPVVEKMTCTIDGVPVDISNFLKGIDTILSRYPKKK